MNPILQALMGRAGIHFAASTPTSKRRAPQWAFATRKTVSVCDAQPTLITTSNAGIPAFLSTYIDPKLIEVLVSPMKAAEIVGDEVKRAIGPPKRPCSRSWNPRVLRPPMAITAKAVTPGVNSNFPQRQSFHYQVMTQWGEQNFERTRRPGPD